MNRQVLGMLVVAVALLGGMYGYLYYIRMPLGTSVTPTMGPSGTQVHIHIEGLKYWNGYYLVLQVSADSGGYPLGGLASSEIPIPASGIINIDGTIPVIQDGKPAECTVEGRILKYYGVGSYQIIHNFTVGEFTVT